MNAQQITAIFTGIFFPLWPLFMNRSGLSGNKSSLVFTAGTLLLVSPFGLLEAKDPNTKIAWLMVLGACIAGALGSLSSNRMLSRATPKEVASLFLITIGVQVVITTLYHAAMNGGLTFSKTVGITFLLLGAYFVA